MDIEFLGILVRPTGNFKPTLEYHYQALKTSVDMLRLTQLDLPFSNEDGNLPTWVTDKYHI